jgi:hypothetical protein
MRQVAYLVKNGVPYEVAMHMSAARRLAWSVTFGELDGQRFDWDSMAWEPKNGP